jgi:hypothetical protein
MTSTPQVPGFSANPWRAMSTTGAPATSGETAAASMPPPGAPSPAASVTPRSESRQRWAPQSETVTLWARQKAPNTQRVTERVRRLVQGLPDWEPLPPGEVLVRRHRA